MINIKKIDLSEVGAALVCIALGIAIIALGSSYSIGELARMGPGYFPVLIGSFLTLIGIGLLFEAKRSTEVKQRFRLRPILALGAGILAFALLIERAGLVPAIFCLVLLSALGESPVRLRSALAISTVMSLAIVLVFIKGLGVPLSIFWW